MSLINQLKNAISKERTPNIVTYSKFTEAITIVDQRSVEDTRNTEWPLHVSSVITDYCVRRLFIMLNGNKTFSKNNSSAMQIVWAMGKAAEKHCVNQLISELGKHNVYGKWLCKCEKTQIYGLGKPTLYTSCFKCDSSAYTNYHELEMLYDNLLVGRPDFLSLMAPHHNLTILETKSLNGKEFEALNKPKVDHIMQAYFYLRIMEHNEKRFTDQGISINKDTFHIVYINKHFTFGSAKDKVYKEFVIRRDSIAPSFAQVFDITVKDLKILKDKKHIPKRILCDSQTDKCAKTCPVVHQCFSWGD